jgi:hypothetical protein
VNRSHWSTEKAAFTLTHKILMALDSKKTVGGIFCDFQKAFDCVKHAVLFQKLEFYGITGIFKLLIGSYLTNRQQSVVLSHSGNRENMSKWETIKCGVPQGSILGPFLFLIYINDLPKIINKEYSMVLNADDASLLITDSNKKDFEANLN